MRVGIIMGGISSEKEVSLYTGKEIIRNIDKDKYEAIPIEIECKNELISKLTNIDFAFIALHGKFGEDGSIQGLLETFNIPYSGSGVLASALCMNKNISKKIFLAEDIKTPKWITIKSINEINYNFIKYPIVVKPNNGGSSIGTFIVRHDFELKDAVEQCLKYDNEIILEEYIEGNEITCAILNGEVLPILSIKSSNTFFDYKSKYSKDGAREEIIELPKNLKKKAEEISIKCWHLFNLKAYGRIDMIIKNDDIYVLEVNTLPGMTETSLFPKSAAGVGIDFSMLIDKIIEYSL